MVDSQYGSIGLEFEAPSMLASNTSYDIQVGLFEIDIQGASIEDCYNTTYGEITATSGSVFIEIYSHTTLKGTFNIFIEADQYTGSFDVNF